MHLPEDIRLQIEDRAEAVGLAALRRAAGELSEAYRSGRTAALDTSERVAGYIVTRLPATYAAAFRVLREVALRLGKPVESVLDVGAGTGAASLAARECLAPQRLTLIERNRGMAEAAREFLPGAEIVCQDFTRLRALPPHDVVIAAYSLGESRVALGHLWEAARMAVVVIEPGTPRGFSLIRELRSGLIAAGARLIAPCPAAGPCPAVEPDWCHFAARVERSSWHRRVKEAALNYEDEKFSYIAAGREPVLLPEARVVRRPQHQPGLIVLETCTPRGLETLRIGKRDRERFRAARHCAWGDVFE